MKVLRIIGLICLSFCIPASMHAVGGHEAEELNVKEFILDHLADSYEWHITTIKDKHICIPLPIIVKGEESGWHLFSSSKLRHGEVYNGFYITKEEKYKGKIVEEVNGEISRPIDLSITKDAASLIIVSLSLISIIMYCTRYYRERKDKPESCSPKGFIAFMEMIILSIVDDLIKPCIGKNYKRYTPYLLTAFFFILFNNFLGLIPIFPGGANVTGNIAVTLVLALFSFVLINVYGTKEYWREIFWPDVPIWLKAFPLMSAIELVGVFTKPFALMIRLFANILAGHAMVLGLICVIFLTVKLGTALNTGMIVLSVIMTIFIDCVEILVAFIQAYVFTMLSAVFIGLSQIEPHHEKH